MSVPLTKMFDTDTAAMYTPPGMAHWAGSGPDGAICDKCQHYERGAPLKGGGFRNGRCGKYATLMRRDGPTFSQNSAACKYFTPKAA
jgi:hypothetical protein